AFASEVLRCLPVDAGSSIDFIGNKNGRVEIEDLPSDHGQFTNLLQGFNGGKGISLENFRKCTMYTEEREDQIEKNISSGKKKAIVGLGFGTVMGAIAGVAGLFITAKFVSGVALITIGGPVFLGCVAVGAFGGILWGLFS
ncbi:MAG: hypothetical protein Q7S68_03085, partial [Deltaproteobacteria bacterium]|nr:hypothetical protein [Deltaproteobacteria bacterium]